MGAMCPNCKIPCTGCAGARLIPASDGKTVCTKCLPGYEANLKSLKTGSVQNAPSNVKILYNPGIVKK